MYHKLIDYNLVFKFHTYLTYYLGYSVYETVY